MYPAKFEYVRVGSVEEAVQLLQQHGEEAKLLAGGHSLIPMMKLRLAQPAVLVDIGAIAALKGVRPLRDGGVEIGAMTTYREIRVAGTGFAALDDVCALIGDLQVRNRGTIGGNLAHNDPASDMTAVALALEANVTLHGPDGERTLPADEFLTGLMETALGPGELVTSVRFLASQPGRAGAAGSAYIKFENPASGYPIVGVAALLAFDAGSRRVSKCRVAVTGAADHAQRLRAVEQALEGCELTAEQLAAACANAGAGLEFMADLQADESYRAHLTRVITRRALEKAAERARA